MGSPLVNSLMETVAEPAEPPPAAPTPGRTGCGPSPAQPSPAAGAEPSLSSVLYFTAHLVGLRGERSASVQHSPASFEVPVT